MYFLCIKSLQFTCTYEYLYMYLKTCVYFIHSKKGLHRYDELRLLLGLPGTLLETFPDSVSQTKNV